VINIVNESLVLNGLALAYEIITNQSY
jgi:hypothetical protein